MINNNIITVNRGDTISFPLFINKGTAIDPVKLELTDSMCLYVGVMEPNQRFEDAIIRKKYTKENVSTDTNLVTKDYSKIYVQEESGLILITFFPDDTVNLFPGKYYIEIKLVDTSTDPETVTTISPKRLFYIID